MEGRGICSRALGYLFMVWSNKSPYEVTQNKSQGHSVVERWPSWIIRLDVVGA